MMTMIPNATQKAQTVFLSWSSAYTLSRLGILSDTLGYLWSVRVANLKTVAIDYLTYVFVTILHAYFLLFVHLIKLDFISFKSAK